MTSQPADDARIAAMLGLVTARHGDRIAPEQLERVREGVKGLAEAISALYTYPLTNADEPDATFFPIQEDCDGHR
jgi:hypothetical protein